MLEFYVADDSQDERMLLKLCGLHRRPMGTVVRVSDVEHDADNDLLVFKNESFLGQGESRCSPEVENIV
jgi:hypothetical protein